MDSINCVYDWDSHDCSVLSPWDMPGVAHRVFIRGESWLLIVAAFVTDLVKTAVCLKLEMSRREN